jgi:putative MATE family efflux protein
MRDLTEGSLVRHLLQFASFIALTMVFQTMYLLVDLYFVGWLGRDAIAGVGLTANLMMVVLALTQSLGVGATALVAHAMGARDRARADTIFNQAFVLSAVAGLAFGITAFALRGAYTRALAADAGTAAEAMRYLTWFVPAMMLQFGLVALGSALRGMGDMKIPTALQVGTVLLNIVLAPILIVGWGTGRPLGVTGAGLATFIAIAAGSVAFVIYFLRPASPVTFRPRTWRPQLGLWREMLRIGVPSGGEFALIAIYIALVYDIIQGFGAAAQAGFGIGGRLMQSLFLPAVAIGFATAPVVGQNVGAKRPDRVRAAFRTAALLVGGVMAVMTVAAHVAPRAMVGVFSADDGVVSFGAEYLRIISWNFVASGIIFVGSSTLQGLGNTRPALLASSLRLILFAAPAYWLSHRPAFEIRHVWYLSVASVLVHVGLLLWLVRRQLDERAPLAA